ncbi:ROK family transcriptional regulator [Kibdelosporangium philippinense]|uniref:ROK family transcriptional regulator n=1 Tax=Kibdelosporangium philippinense TaxID=211113 RepID=A0ABS8Z657_9PSEU|nr:ROK family transcriptional regulator [Kibdelosporangium philippinense]MCE7003366.1 ROK family transcriptional regulator [Kibdelosporangium philippinense]
MRAGSPRLLREINDRAAIDALLRDGPLTRSELEYAIGLSKPATAQLLARLEEEGVVVREGLRGGGRGPRAQLWAVKGAVAHVAAIDLTPRGVDIAIADISGAVLTEHRQAVPPRGTSDEVLSNFRQATVAACAAAGLTLKDLRHVVVGTPGAINPRTGHLWFAPHLPGWEGFDMPGRIGAELGVPVTIENDVNLVALEEMIAGQATAVRSFVMVWLDHGIGGAIVVDRKLLRGATGGAGEIDWMHVPDRAAADTGIPATGTRFGDLVSSPNVVKLARAYGIAARNGWTAVSKAVAQIDEKETSEQQQGKQFLTDLARRVATGVASVVSVVDPELVLLCGKTGLAGGEMLCRLISTELRNMVVPRTPVAYSALAGNAVRAGALHSALAVVREQVFGLTGDITEPSRRLDASGDGNGVRTSF